MLLSPGGTADEELAADIARLLAIAGEDEVACTPPSSDGEGVPSARPLDFTAPLEDWTMIEGSSANASAMASAEASSSAAVDPSLAAAASAAAAASVASAALVPKDEQQLASAQPQSSGGGGSLPSIASSTGRASDEELFGAHSFMRIVAASVAVSALLIASSVVLGPTSDTYRYDVRAPGSLRPIPSDGNPAAILPIARFVEATTLGAAQGTKDAPSYPQPNSPLVTPLAVAAAPHSTNRKRAPKGAVTLTSDPPPPPPAESTMAKPRLSGNTPNRRVPKPGGRMAGNAPPPLLLLILHHLRRSLPRSTTQQRTGMPARGRRLLRSARGTGAGDAVTSQRYQLPPRPRRQLRPRWQ